jgi:3'-phosphoadenosine 5'-phosphosulfate sulfotransferase (PAPS reductase)/FAD synthetase
MNNQLEMFEPEGHKLTILSLGAGQDSVVLLLMYIENFKTNGVGFREQFVHEDSDFLIIMSDTGNEFPATLKTVEYCNLCCIEAGIDFVYITKDMGYHSKSWPSLVEFYESHDTIGSKAFPKTCSANLKIYPIYRFIERYISDKYGVFFGKKKGFREFAAIHGKIVMIIGISKGEEKRTSDASESKQRWYRESIQHSYPLIPLGYDRQKCQDFLHARNLRVIPSNCIFCPFLSKEELEYISRFHPEELKHWVTLEQNKLDRFQHLNKVQKLDKDGKPALDRHGEPKLQNKNYGVFGVKPLPVVIKEAKEEFAEWSDERVRDYRYSHGHCVSTSY